MFYHSLTFSCSFHCQQNQSRKFKGCLISVNNQSENSTVISLSANSSCTSCVCLRSQWCVLPSGWSVFTLKAITGTVVFALGCCRRLRWHRFQKMYAAAPLVMDKYFLLVVRYGACFWIYSCLCVCACIYSILFMLLCLIGAHKIFYQNILSKYFCTFLQHLTTNNLFVIEWLPKVSFFAYTVQ